MGDYIIQEKRANEAEAWNLQAAMALSLLSQITET